MKAIVGQFVFHPQQNERSGGDAGGQTGKVKKAKSLVCPEVAEGKFEIVLKHFYFYFCFCLKFPTMLNEDIFENPTLEKDYETERNKPIPTKLHGIIQTEIIFQLRLRYNDQYDFPTEVTLDTTPASVPDICVYPRKEEFDRKETPAKEPEMPITTIEIISPSQSLDELTQKAWKIYFPNGVKSAWIVMPAIKAISVLLPDDQNLLVNSGELTDPATGIQVSVDKIFERIS
jgi:Uma2 family endonuclease